jgi:hypothetical protein
MRVTDWSALLRADAAPAPGNLQGDGAPIGHGRKARVVHPSGARAAEVARDHIMIDARKIGVFSKHSFVANDGHVPPTREAEHLRKRRFPQTQISFAVLRWLAEAVSPHLVPPSQNLHKGTRLYQSPPQEKARRVWLGPLARRSRTHPRQEPPRCPPLLPPRGKPFSTLAITP